MCVYRTVNYGCAHSRIAYKLHCDERPHILGGIPAPAASCPKFTVAAVSAGGPCPACARQEALDGERAETLRRRKAALVDLLARGGRGGARDEGGENWPRTWAGGEAKGRRRSVGARPAGRGETRTDVDNTHSWHRSTDEEDRGRRDGNDALPQPEARGDTRQGSFESAETGANFPASGSKAPVPSLLRKRRTHLSDQITVEGGTLSSIWKSCKKAVSEEGPEMLPASPMESGVLEEAQLQSLKVMRDKKVELKAQQCDDTGGASLEAQKDVAAQPTEDSGEAGAETGKTAENKGDALRDDIVPGDKEDSVGSFAETNEHTASVSPLCAAPLSPSQPTIRVEAPSEVDVQAPDSGAPVDSDRLSRRRRLIMARRSIARSSPSAQKHSAFQAFVPDESSTSMVAPPPNVGNSRYSAPPLSSSGAGVAGEKGPPRKLSLDVMAKSESADGPSLVGERKRLAGIRSGSSAPSSPTSEASSSLLVGPQASTQDWQESFLVGALATIEPVPENPSVSCEVDRGDSLRLPHTSTRPHSLGIFPKWPGQEAPGPTRKTPATSEEEQRQDIPLELVSEEKPPTGQWYEIRLDDSREVAQTDYRAQLPSQARQVSTGSATPSLTRRQAKRVPMMVPSPVPRTMAAAMADMMTKPPGPAYQPRRRVRRHIAPPGRQAHSRIENTAADDSWADGQGGSDGRKEARLSGVAAGDYLSPDRIREEMRKIEAEAHRFSSADGKVAGSDDRIDDQSLQKSKCCWPPPEKGDKEEEKHAEADSDSASMVVNFTAKEDDSPHRRRRRRRRHRAAKRKRSADKAEAEQKQNKRSTVSSLADLHRADTIAKGKQAVLGRIRTLVARVKTTKAKGWKKSPWRR